MGLRTVLIIALATIHGSNAMAVPSTGSAPTPQEPLSFIPSPSSDGPSAPGGHIHGRNGRPLKGRFLHVTDIHPDELYIPESDIKTGCHYLTPKPKRADRAGYWGSSMSDCDSPLNLFNMTMDWLETEWADKVDFVIWTGDSARHDIDNGHPRTPAEIYESNRMATRRMEDIFLSRNVPVVPSLGNNDIWPHNIMYPGPSSVTNEFSSIWSHFIPFESYQVFQRGAYFSFDIIPNELGALSLNTLYWYDNNKAVEGCKKGEPGSLELDWLEVQLDVFRERGMQVWLSGHVPPTPGNYFPDCYRRYGELAIRFQDTIVGQLFGHMNVDHFFWIDTEDIRPPSKSSLPPSPPPPSLLSSLLSTFLSHFKRSLYISNTSSNETVGNDKVSLDAQLKEDFGSLPGIKKLDMDNFIIVNVGPSVVPTYYPSVRVFTYNATGGPSAGSAAMRARRRAAAKSKFEHRRSHDYGPSITNVDVVDPDEEVENEDEFYMQDEDDMVLVNWQQRKRVVEPSKRRHGHQREERKVDCRLKKNKGKKSCRIKKPRYNDPKSPSRTNTLWTPLGYTQFSMPGLDDATADTIPQYTLEYMTYDLDVLDNATDYPVPHRLLPEELFDLDNTTDAQQNIRRKYVPYGLPDLTVESWMRLAKRLGNGKHQKLWKRFKTIMYMDD